MTLYQVAEELSRRLTSILARDKDGRRALYGGTLKFQDDKDWRDPILFCEYFHGDNGAGLGASHQTGWTGIISRAMHLFATTTTSNCCSSAKQPQLRRSGRALARLLARLALTKFENERYPSANCE
jgi:hypothetical protein